MLSDVISHAREDVDKVADTRSRALFETTAEAIQGLVRTSGHFEPKSEAARRRVAADRPSDAGRSKMATRDAERLGARWPCCTGDAPAAPGSP